MKHETGNLKLLILSSILLMFILLDIIRDAQSLKTFIKNASDNFLNDSLNISYSIQIAASYTTKINQDSLKHEYKLTSDLKEIFHNGWYKYSAGSFTNLLEARKFRLELMKEKGIGGAFIVCFKNNIRQDNIIIPKNFLTTKNEQLKTNYEYRVQIKASNIKIPLDTVAKQFNLVEKIIEDFNDNWFKYTIGSFDNYRSAKDFRNKLRQKKGLSDCFVVVYENGQRLSQIPLQIKSHNFGLSDKSVTQNPEPKPQSSAFTSQPPEPGFIKKI